MANLLGGGGDGMGGAGLPLEAWFYEMPIITRCWTTATAIAGILVQCHTITPYQLFYSHRAVFTRGQYWRLLTTFIYYSPLSLNLVFHIYFIQRYARMIEESAPSVAHFTWLLLFASTSLLMIAPLFKLTFLSSALSSTLVYIWSRRNPDVRLSFFGVITFTAPWLPWVLIAFNVVLHEYWPKDNLCGIMVGHVYYFLNDIYPATHNGFRPMDPPHFWVRLFQRAPAQIETEVQEAVPDREMVAPVIPNIG